MAPPLSINAYRLDKRADIPSACPTHTHTRLINLSLSITDKTLATYTHLASHSTRSSCYATAGLNALCLRMMSAQVEVECPRKSQVK